MDAAEIIRAMRKQKGWTQMQLAIVSHIPRHTIWNIENRAVSSPRIDSFEPLLNAMGYELEIVPMEKERLR